MTEQPRPPNAPDDPADTPALSSDANATPGAKWEGPTYYNRPQLKAAPFNNWVVGGYIFLAGLSGGSALVAALADAARGPHAARLVRRGRYVSLLAPTVGSVLLIWDLHTPKRFYNMFRVAKGTSPMSIGTWILTAFSAFAGLAAAGQMLTDRLPRLRWPARLSRAAQLPAAVAGAGLATYTASLLASTSTPLWAAAPRPLAARFGASSIAAAAAALALGERGSGNRNRLDALTVTALAAELAAARASHRVYREKRVDAALDGPWGRTERHGATGLGILVPFGLQAAVALLGADRNGPAAQIARLAVLAGSALLRVSIMGAGDVSANRPDISFRYSQPENLPRPRRSRGRKVAA